MANETSQKVIDVLNKDIYPLFKVEFEDTHYMRDVDSDIWLDSEEHELIRKGHKAMAYVKEKYGDEWKVLYDNLSSNMVRASLELEEIKSNYSYWKSIYVDTKPVMFIYQNNVFKNSYVMMDQLCIAGEPIEPEKYYTNDGRVKVSFFGSSYVKPIPENTILIHAEQIYFNGELLYSKPELVALGVRTYSTGEILAYAKNNVLGATAYTAEWESGPIR